MRTTRTRTAPQQQAALPRKQQQQQHFVMMMRMITRRRHCHFTMAVYCLFFLLLLNIHHPHYNNNGVGFVVLTNVFGGGSLQCLPQQQPLQYQQLQQQQQRQVTTTTTSLLLLTRRQRSTGTTTTTRYQHQPPHSRRSSNNNIVAMKMFFNNNNNNKETKKDAGTTTTATATQEKEKPTSSSSTTTTTTTNNNNNSNNDTTNELVENLSKAAFQMGSDFLVALRWGAANALTAALPEEQRKVLLERMDPEPPTTSKKFLQEATSSNEKETTTKGSGGKDLVVVLKKSDTEDNDDEKAMTIQNSVNEAVAMAVAVQSQREKKWEQEKSQIVQMAQEAATQRVTTDFLIQKQRMEQEQHLLQQIATTATRALALEKQKRLEQEAKAKAAAAEAERIRIEEQQKQLEQEEKEAAQRREQQEKDRAVSILVSHNGTDDTMDTSGYNTLSVHPILGPPLSDLGYKRLHFVSASHLATIPVWKKQRIYRHERAKAMAADKLKTMHLGLPGVICLHEETNGKLYILDGQHRVGMMKIIQEKQQQQQQSNKNSATTIDLDRILVEVYPQSSDISKSPDHAQDIFMEINKAEPIKLVDMPGVATAKDRNMISQAVYRLEDQYSIMFSPSQRCRSPNVNVDNLRDQIFAANVIKRHKITSASQLTDWLLQQNFKLGTKYQKDMQAQQELNAGAWKKASTHNFYLGLESSWLYN